MPTKPFDHRHRLAAAPGGLADDVHAATVLPRGFGGRCLRGMRGRAVGRRRESFTGQGIKRIVTKSSVGRRWECVGSRSCACSGGSLIAVVRELERYREVFRPHGGDHRLQVVAALARHADLLVLDLRGHFEL